MLRTHVAAAVLAGSLLVGHATCLAQACPAGWQYYNGNCYKLTSVEQDWGAAEAEAVSEGGHLVAIGDSSENQWLLDTFGDDANSIWIGHYQDTEAPAYSEPAGGWVWSNGEPFVYTNWDSGEPNNNHTDGEDCGDMRGHQPAEPDGSWNDLPCTAPILGIIETSGSAVPTVSEWGLAVMALLLLTAGTLVYARRRGVSSIAG